MKIFVSIAVLQSALLLAGPVSAIELSNANEDPVSVVVIEENGKKTYSIGAGETLKNICMQGCSIKLPNGDDFAFLGSEIATIEGENIYDDTPGEDETANEVVEDTDNDVVEDVE